MTYCFELEQKYVKEYQKLHCDTSFKNRGWIYGYGDGKATANNIHYIKKLVDKYQVKSLLDYGCGKAIHHVEKDLYTSIGVKSVALYDPAIPEFSKLSENVFDCVVCIDVLEHIPEQNLKHVFDQINNRAKYFIFFTISCNPSRDILSTGENAHITQKSTDWWLEQLKYISKPVYVVMSYNNRNLYFDLSAGT